MQDVYIVFLLFEFIKLCMKLNGNKLVLEKNKAS